VFATNAEAVTFAPSFFGGLALSPDGSGLAVGTGIGVVEAVVVLSPLVIISLEPSGVLLVVVRASGDAVVRLAPSGILVLTVGLFGPGVVVVSSLSSSALGRCTSPELSALGVLATGPAALAALSVSVVFVKRGLATVG